MASSKTTRNRGFSPEVARRFKDVAARVLDKAIQNSPISEYDLEAWNKILSAGIDGEEENDFDRLVQFIIRGKVRTEMEPERIRVLDTNFSVTIGSSINHLAVNLLGPPSPEVPELVRKVLAQANSITAASTLLDICAIYRDFIVAHPFFNGNGRVARFLVEFSLLKAKFALTSTRYLGTSSI